MNCRSFRLVLLVAAVVALLPCLVGRAYAGVPVISEVSDTTADRSQRIVISGNGFGSSQGTGEVTIDGTAAWVTRWTETFINAYIPETASLGEVGVQVVTNAGASNVVPISVSARSADGRVQWRMAVEGDYMLHAPGVGPDGTVYINDLHGRLYAVRADGALLWIVDTLRGRVGGGTEGPVVVGDDGTVYVAANPLGPEVELLAYSPNGDLLWSFTEPDAYTVAVGPAIGPDGNLYAVFHDQDRVSSGAVSFTPAGELRWSNPGAPGIYEHGGIGAELAFSASNAGGAIDQIVFTVDNDSSRLIYAFDMATGTQRWEVPAAVNDNFEGQTVMAAGPEHGLVYIMESNGWGLQAFASSDGSRSWRFSPGIRAYATNPTVGPDGIVYFGWEAGHLSAVAPDGTGRWESVFPDGSATGRPSTTPDNRFVLVQGFASFEPGWLKALDPSDGSLAWQVDFGMDDGSNILPRRPVEVTPDSRRVFVPVAVSDRNPSNEHAYVYAIAIDSLEFTLTPRSTTVAAGETLTYDVVLTNTDTTTQTHDAWIDVLRPSGAPYARNPIAGPKRFTLSPGQTVRKTVHLRIPAQTPPSGPYTLRGSIGGFPGSPSVTASFEFSVVP